MIRLRDAVGIAALVVVLTGADLGCEQKQPERSKPASAPSIEGKDAASPEARADSPMATPTLRVMEPGAEPRTALRYTFIEGAEQTVIMNLVIRASQGIDGAAEPDVKLPGFRLVLSLTVPALVGDDRARSRFELTSAQLTDTADVDAMVLSTTKRDLERAVGAIGSCVVDRRGFRSEHELQTPGGVSEQMRQLLIAVQISLDQLSTPLPETPVGDGAEWEHTQLLTQNGIEVRQTTLFHLQEHVDGHGTLRATVRLAAEPQTADLPGLPAGVGAEVLSLIGRGGGELVFDLSKPAPMAATMSVLVQASFAIKTGGQSQKIVMKADNKLVLESAR